MARLRVTSLRRHIDPASLVVIGLTLVLFLAALAVKGVGHDLLLEAGVFLVSVKLIIMAYKGSATTQGLAEELAAIRAGVERLENQLRAAQAAAFGNVQESLEVRPSHGGEKKRAQPGE